MLSGAALGAALSEAMALKKVTQQEVATEFGIKQPSVSEWERFGRIAKKHLTHLVAYFSTHVGPEHWGLPSSWQASPVASAEPVARPAMRAPRAVPVVGRCQGGFPARTWGDGDQPIGVTDEYAMVATIDDNAFVCQVVGPSMVARYMPGEYALIEPNTAPEIEDDVLVRLHTGETMLKRLLSRRGGVRLGSYADPEVFSYREDEITWMYYVAHPIPARRIQHRMESDQYQGEDRRHFDRPQRARAMG